MALGLENHEIKALSQSNKSKPPDIDLILDRMKRTKSVKRRLPYKASSQKTYAEYLSSLYDFAHANMKVIKDLYSDELQEVLRSVKAFRLLLMESDDPPIDEVIDLCLLPKFVEYLGSAELELQFEAAWIVTNVAVGNTFQTRYLIESGAPAALIRLLWSEKEKVRVQSVWALGNIAGDLHGFREYVVAKGAIPGVVHVIKSATRDSNLLKCAWALENLFTGNQEHYTLVQTVPVLHHLLKHRNEEVVLAAMRLLTILSCRVEMVKELFNIGVQATLKEFILRRGDSLSNALQIFSNISNVKGDCFKQRLLEEDILRILLTLVHTTDFYLLGQISEIMFNLSCGNHRQIQSIVKSELLYVLWDKVRDYSEEEVISYVVNTTHNIVCKGTNSIIKDISENGIVSDLCFVLESESENLIYKVLCTLEPLLTFGDKESLYKKTRNSVACELVECGGLEILETLLSHESKDIYLKAYEIIERYFEEEDEPNNFDLEEMYEKCVSVIS